MEAARHTELAEDAGEVRLDGSLGDGEPIGDLLVAGPGRDEGDELALPLARAPDPTGARARRPRRGRGELLEELGGDAASDPDLPVSDLLDGDRKSVGEGKAGSRGA